MMVEVIKKYARKLEFTCPECGSVSKLDESDIRCNEQYPYQPSYSFNCPVCLHRVYSSKGIIELINDKCFRRLYEQDNADEYLISDLSTINPSNPQQFTSKSNFITLSSNLTNQDNNLCISNRTKSTIDSLKYLNKKYI